MEDPTLIDHNPTQAQKDAAQANKTTLYSPKFGTLVVDNPGQLQAAKAAGFTEKMPYFEFPRHVYHKTLGTRTVNSKAEQDALGEGWATQPHPPEPPKAA